MGKGDTEVQFISEALAALSAEITCAALQARRARRRGYCIKF
jgi:hypothetical protein